MTGMQSPSKYLSLRFLRTLQTSYYKSTSGIEYFPSEVDNLIATKEDALMVGDKKSFQEWADYCFGLDAELEAVEEIPFPSDYDMPFFEIETALVFDITGLSAVIRVKCPRSGKVLITVVLRVDLSLYLNYNLGMGGNQAHQSRGNTS